MKPKSFTVPSMVTDAVMRRTLVVSFSWSTCGNCGRGGMFEPLNRDGENICLHCGARWIFCSFEIYLFDESMRPTKESMESKFPGLEFIGVAEGSVAHGYSISLRGLPSVD